MTDKINIHDPRRMNAVIEAMEREWAKTAACREAMRSGPLVLICTTDEFLAAWRNAERDRRGANRARQNPLNPYQNGLN